MLFPCLFLHSQTSTAFKAGKDTNSNDLHQLLLSSNNFYKQRQYPESNKYLEKALLVIEKMKDKTEEPGIYNRLGRNYCALGDLSKGFEHYYKALQVSEKLGDKKEMANACQY